MFDQQHGVAFVVYALLDDIQKGAYVETYDGGKTWTTLDTSKLQGNFQPFVYPSRDGTALLMYEAPISLNNVPNTLYLWKNNGKERTTITVPTDYSILFPISADTLFYTVPGELYRMILSPNTSVEEPKAEDYETSVFLQSPFPNPAASTVQIPVWYYAATVRPDDISVACYDLTGAKVADLTRTLKPVSGGYMTAEWDMSALPSGVYIVRCQSSNRRGNARIVVKAGAE